MFQISHDKVVLDELVLNEDHQGRTLSRWLNLTSFVTTASFLLPQVVKITDLKGLVLGQEFSIKWELPVSDLEKFNCYPDEPPLTLEHCRKRGCLWEVMIWNTSPQ